MLKIASVIAILIATSAVAMAAEDVVMPPEGTVSILEVEGDGVQIYACEAKDAAFAWVFKGPEANLFDSTERQVGVHGAGPSWKLSDGSSVVGEKIAEAPATEVDSVPWLLLKAKTHDGKGLLTDANWVRRYATIGGVAPQGGCDAQHVNETARMHYSAQYQFFR